MAPRRKYVTSFMTIFKELTEAESLASFELRADDIHVAAAVGHQAARPTAGGEETGGAAVLPLATFKPVTEGRWTLGSDC